MSRGWFGLLLLWPALAALDQALVTPRGGVPVWAALGAGAGVLAWRGAVSRQLRLRFWLPLLLIGWLLALGSLEALVAWTPLARHAPDRWVMLPQCLSAAATCFAMVAGLRSLSWRYPPLAVLELAVAGNIFVGALSAHRDGHINRPFDVVDLFWLRGWDPTPLFLAFGALGLVALALLATQRPGNRRPWWDVPLLLGLLLALFLASPPQKVQQVLEKFGMGNLPGEENRLRPEGNSPTPKPGQGKNPNQNPQKDPSDGRPQPTRPRDEPSFADASSKPKPQPVAVVIFRDDVEPFLKTYYFRQTCNSLYNGLKLIRSNDNRYDRDVAQSFPSRARDQQTPDGLGMQVLPMQPEFSKSIPTRVVLMSQHPRPFGLNNAVTYWSAGNPDPARFQKAYEVDSQVFQATIPQLLSSKVGSANWDEAAWKHYLEGPKDPRYRELADRIVATLPASRRQSPIYRAVAIKLWLDKNCTYSLKSPSAQAADPVSDFLFGQRIGYCVFTSHSACYLYRAAGVPARIAEGYAVPSQQRGGGSSLLIRSNNAHSWPEICLQGVGWLELDIAPEKNLEPESDPLDSNLQQMMGDMARKDKKERRPEEDKPAFDLLAWLRQLLVASLWVAPGGLLLVLSLLWGWKLLRRWRPWFVAGRSLPRAAYISVLDQLCERGYRRRLDESQEAFARRLSGAMPELLTLTRMHLRARLSDKPDAAPEEVRRVLRACLSQLAPLGPGWRRWLGRFDPTSPLRIR